MTVDEEEFLTWPRKYYRLADYEDIYIARDNEILMRLQNLKRDRLQKMERHQGILPEDFDYEKARLERLKDL